MPQKKETWEERFEKLPLEYLDMVKHTNDYYSGEKKIRKFISQEIQKAREEERKMWIRIVQGNHKGAFIDDGFNKCRQEIINKAKLKGIEI